MKYFAIMIFLLMWYSEVLGTAQVPDLMVIGKDTFLMHTNPLETYLDLVGNRVLPDFKGRGSTACWRGYQAVWRIENDSLFLEKIQSCHRDQGTVNANLTKMFGEKCVNGRVYAYWFTGLIVVPHGRIRQYVHMGYGSTYQKYLLIEINKGQHKQQLKFNKRQYKSFKTRQFELFKETEDYRNIVDDLKKEGNYDQTFIDSFLKSFIIEYTSRILYK